MRRCKISEILVFVPTYNSEKYLRECLDSVLHQTFQDWECVISDDASTDKSVEIAREYEKKDSRFRVLTYEKNVGAADNWNRSKEDNESFAYRLDELPGDLVRNDRSIVPPYTQGKLGGVPKL